MTLDAHTEPPSALDVFSSHTSLREMSSPSDSASPQGVAAHESIVTGGPGIVNTRVTHCESVQFAERVRRVMRVCGLTIRSAAFRWGYAPTTIQAWRSGKSEPRWSEWEAIERHELAELRGTGT